jgi:hypothetical protein
VRGKLGAVVQVVVGIVVGVAMFLALVPLMY